MRAKRGFTLLELMVVVAIVAIVGALVVWQGRSARQNAAMAGGAYDLALRIGGIKGRAMADGRDYLLVVVDTPDPSACVHTETKCGRAVVLRSPDTAVFSLGTFDPDATLAGAEYVEDTYLPRNSQFDLASAWRPPAPFNTVQAAASTLSTCADARRCFALRFRATGEVREFPETTPAPAGFAFVLKPFEAPSAAADRRGLFVSFPAGIVKTAAF